MSACAVFAGRIFKIQSVAVLIGQRTGKAEAMTEQSQPISKVDLAILNLIRGEAGTDQAISWAILGLVDTEFVSRVRRIRELDGETHDLKRNVTCENHCGPIEFIPCVECNWHLKRPMRFSVEGELWRMEQERLQEEKTSTAQRIWRRIEKNADSEPDETLGEDEL